MGFDPGPGDPEYNRRLSEEYFIHIVPRMMAKNKRINVKFVKLLHKMLLIYQYPTLDQILERSNYAQTTVNTLKSGLRKLPYIDENDKINGLFYNDYYRYLDLFFDMKSNMDVSIVDSEILDEVEINSLFNYKDIINTLKNNVRIKFLFPDDIVSGELDYLAPKVQYVKFNHIGSNTAVPFPISYYYKCRSCGGVQRFDTLPKGKKCPLAQCSGTLYKDSDQDVVAHVYASQVTVAGKTISAISLVEIPNGEFTAAILICRDSNNTRYHAFILAVEEKQYESARLEIKQDTHAMWQLIDIIDEIHESRMNFHIDGMDYYKAAILMSIIANFSGFKSYNVLIAGRSGGAKTVTPKWYYNTVSVMCKVQDVVSVSLPGIVGSSTTINVNGQMIKVDELGLLARHEFVVLDELYNKAESGLISQLKGSLSSPTISKEVAGNRSEVTKSACVTATANIEPAIYNASRLHFKRYLESYLADPSYYKDIDDYTAAAVADNIFETDVGIIISKTVMYQYSAEGLNWIDGQSHSDLDRFALLFYVGNPILDNSEDDIPDHIFDTVDLEISTPDLQRAIYSQDVRDYLQYCAKIKVRFGDEMRVRIKEFIKEVKRDDHVHSSARLSLYIKKTIELSAMMCGRDYVSTIDFDFVRDLFSKTCKWVEIDDMRSRIKPKGMEYFLGDRIKPDADRVEAYVHELFCKYELLGKGSSFRERALINIECDIQTKFMIDDPNIAHRHVENYILKNGNRDVSEIYVEPDDAAIETLYYNSTTKDLTSIEFRDMLVDEFTKRKTISKDELDELSASSNVSVSDLNEHLDHFRQQRMIQNMGDEYRWIV